MSYLIINADDFGYSKVFNKKIIELFEKGYLTATSVMVNWINNEQKDQIDKIKELKRNKDISIGLHVEFKNEDFLNQIQEQHKKFVSIFEFEPTHVDLHKGTYLENGYPVIMQYCLDNNLPCKNYGIVGSKALMTKEKTYAATGDIFPEIKEWLKLLKSKETYLIEMHPGIFDRETDTKWNKVREVDAKHIEMISKIADEYNVKLVSFEYLHKME